jgi:DNA-binding NarL/FixJ family response regulator
VPIGLEAASDDGTPDVSAANAPAPNPLDMLQARVDALVPSYGLTPREQEVAFLTVQGFSCGYIAEKLVVSESTVRFHQKNLYRKLDVHSRNELIEFVNNTTS